MPPVKGKAAVAERAVSDDEEDDGASKGSKGCNYKFYKGTIPSRPDGGFVNEIHSSWFGNYALLEMHHGYIQWLFPLFEGGGMNWHADALEKEEAALMRKDPEIAIRIVKSYKMMLDFYGISLVDVTTGRLERNHYWKYRYNNLNGHSHNFLRISRIVQSLGHLGFSRYKKPFLDFMEQEIMHNKQIPNAKHSLQNFWLPILDVNSKAFIKKTLETEEDREDSVFFSLPSVPEEVIQYGKQEIQPEEAL